MPQVTTTRSEVTARGRVSQWPVAAGFFVVAGAILVASALAQPVFALIAFCGWLAVESSLRSRQPRGRFRGGPATSIPALLLLFRRSDAAAERLLAEKIARLELPQPVDEKTALAIRRIKDLVELRGLAFGSPAAGKAGLRSAFIFRRDTARGDAAATLPLEIVDHLSLNDLDQATGYVAKLYLRLLESCEHEEGGQLQQYARQLFLDLFGVPYENGRAKKIVAALTDAMQLERGLPYALLNLVHHGERATARALAQRALVADFEIDEDLRSAAYWIAELGWFKRQETPLRDFDAVVRHLYHLCFTDPDRAGFLEIDSRFFSQFEAVNEVAREGLLFREDLFDRVLALWSHYEGFFDGAFTETLETLSRSRSKIFTDRDNWVRFWARERERFGREWLFVVEGNLSYASGHWQDAKQFYEKALAADPSLRAALLNLPFAEARLGDGHGQRRAVERMLAHRELYPASLYVAGDSYLLAGDERRAEAFYEELSGFDGWEQKADYYKSTFCYENGLFEPALRFAKAAHESAPGDTAIAFQLSLCYSANGKNAEALALVQQVIEEDDEPSPSWLRFHRFTLERDAGQMEAASRTLLDIPSDYFEEEELEAAQRFARDRRDFELLRHLRVARSKM